MYTYFFLIFLKFSKGHIQVFVHMLISKELNCSLVDFPCMGKVSMLLFKSGILDPVLHSRVHQHECRGVKESRQDTTAKPIMEAEVSSVLEPMHSFYKGSVPKQ